MDLLPYFQDLAQNKLSSRKYNELKDKIELMVKRNKSFYVKERDCLDVEDIVSNVIISVSNAVKDPSKEFKSFQNYLITTISHSLSSIDTDIDNKEFINFSQRIKRVAFLELEKKINFASNTIYIAINESVLGSKEIITENELNMFLGEIELNELNNIKRWKSECIAELSDIILYLLKGFNKKVEINLLFLHLANRLGISTFKMNDFLSVDNDSDSDEAIEDSKQFENVISLEPDNKALPFDVKLRLNEIIIQCEKKLNEFLSKSKSKEYDITLISTSMVEELTLKEIAIITGTKNHTNIDYHLKSRLNLNNILQDEYLILKSEFNQYQEVVGDELYKIILKLKKEITGKAYEKEI